MHDGLRRVRSLARPYLWQDTRQDTRAARPRRHVRSTHTQSRTLIRPLTWNAFPQARLPLRANAATALAVIGISFLLHPLSSAVMMHGVERARELKLH